VESFLSPSFLSPSLGAAVGALEDAASGGEVGNIGEVSGRASRLASTAIYTRIISEKATCPDKSFSG